MERQSLRTNWALRGQRYFIGKRIRILKILFRGEIQEEGLSSDPKLRVAKRGTAAGVWSTTAKPRMRGPTRRVATRSARPESRRIWENGGTIENAQAIAAHESPRMTKLYDRPGD